MEVGEMLLKTASDADTTVSRKDAASSLRAPAGPQRNGQGPQWRISVHFIEAKRFTDEDNEIKYEHFHPVIEAVVRNMEVWLMRAFGKTSRVARYLHSSWRNGASPFQEISQGAFDLWIN